MSGASYIAVVGGGDASGDVCALARDVGRELAARGAVVLCGGLGGVMEAVCRGVVDGGGVSIGILPGDDRAGANEWATFTVPTGMGEARNSIVARAADGMIAVDGEYGTLSEIALALRNGTPVVGLGTWELRRPDGGDDGIVRVDTAEAAVTLVLELAGR